MLRAPLCFVGEDQRGMLRSGSRPRSHGRKWRSWVGFCQISWAGGGSVADFSGHRLGLRNVLPLAQVREEAEEDPQV